MKDFKDKVAVITGAASGIDYALAERAAKEGMKVVLADVEEGALAQAKKDIKALGATTLVVKTDVSKPDDVKALAEKALEAFGEVHLLCNNAGVSAGSITWESILADWKWVLGVNLWGVIYGIHYFVPIMLKQNNECYIVNTASGAGLLTLPGSSPYSVSKHGVVVLSEILYRELKQGSNNIGVSVLCPGYVRTKVMDCDRNRPAALRNAPGEEAVYMSDPRVQEAIKAARQVIEDGMPPQQAADIVFDAIKENKFYILPNAEEFKPFMQARMEDIARERNPTTVPLESLDL